MNIRDRKRRPRGGPNPGRLRATESSRYWVNYLSAFRTCCLSRPETMGGLMATQIARANWHMSASARRYVRIRLKEASR